MSLTVAVYTYLDEDAKKQLFSTLPDAKFLLHPTEEDIRHAEVILGEVPVDRIRFAEDLKWLQLSMAGTDPYIPKGVLPEDVILTNATGAFGLAISEHMVAATMMLVKKLHLYRDNMQTGRWLDRGTVDQIEGKTVLCVGLGDIGGRYAQKMKALGAHVIGVRRREMPKPDYVDEVYTQEKLDEVLPRADIVALSMPNTAQTRKMFDRERLEKMKPGSYLINVGRGNAVDCIALAELLDAERLGGAALDVTDPEPLPSDHPLWKCRNALITPHVSGFYHLPKTYRNIIDIFADNLKRYASGQPLRNIVDRETGYCK